VAGGTSDVAIALSAVGALLLLTAGVTKVRQPDATARVLHDSLLPRGWPSPRVAARIVGASEVAVGLLALIVGSRWSYLVLAGYYALLLAVAVRLRAGDSSDCGCFGASESPAPISWAHLATSGVVMTAALGACLDPPGALGGAGVLSARGLLACALVLVLTYLTHALLTRLPALTRARKEVLDL
jgi:hypothetical protein